MGSRSAKALLAAAAAAFGAAGMFVVMTVAVEPVRPALLLAVSGLTALAAVVVFQGRPTLSAMRSAEPSVILLAALGGGLALWAAPLLAQSQRASDAPSGADTLFLTTTVWGVLCVALAYAIRRERPQWTALASAGAAAAATAALLASWETPSSFSPFSKFPVREGLIVVAGLVFAAGALALARAARVAGWRVVSVAAAAGGAAMGLLGGLVSFLQQGGLSGATFVLGGYLGLSLAVFIIGWTQSIAESGLARASVALIVVPVFVMAVSFFESTLNVYGPSPVAWASALAATAAIAATSAGVWLARMSPTPRPDGAAGALVHTRIALWLSAAAFALGVVALFTPALTATASGGTAAPFEATWTMLGYESAAGWLVVGAAGLALASVMSVRQGGGPRVWLPTALAAIVCGLSAIPLFGTTLHTWNDWVPADVQQTYGTEYSRLVTHGRIEPVRVAALALAVGAVIVLALVARSRTLTTGLSEEDL